MIKFFRKIRYSLMSENKTGKYLKYAIGEIVLVVIGILIALQINNWNEERKAKINENALYSRMITDLIFDENRINRHIQLYKEDLEILNTIYQETQVFSSQDSIDDFGSIRAGRIFDLIISANYSKNTKDIGNEKIIETLNKYFTLEHHVKDGLEILWNFKEEHVKPYLAKCGINDSKELFNNRSLSYYELRKENIFSYSKLKEQYGTVELDQLLFDLGVRTSWAKTALEDLLLENKQLQLDLTNVLEGN